MRYSILFLVATINYCMSMDLQPQGHIILLNGTTTAGKSSIARELKQKLQAQFLQVEVLAIDSFMAPKIQYELTIRRLNPFNFLVPNSDLITPLALQEIGKESQSELCRAVKIACQKGKVVIVDAPVYQTEQVTFYQKNLADFSTSWVLAYCPLQTLIDRVIKRNEQSSVIEQRSILQALYQFNYMYCSQQNKPIDILTEQRFSTVLNTSRVENDLAQERISDFLKGIQKAICIHDFNGMAQLMRGNLSFNQYGIANICPVVPYDCIVNTQLYDPVQCAEEIIQTLKLE